MNRNTVTTTVTQIMAQPSNAFAGINESHHQHQCGKTEGEQQREKGE